MGAQLALPHYFDHGPLRGQFRRFRYMYLRSGTCREGGRSDVPDLQLAAGEERHVLNHSEALLDYGRSVASLNGYQQSAS